MSKCTLSLVEFVERVSTIFEYLIIFTDSTLMDIYGDNSCFLCGKVFANKIIRDFHLDCLHGLVGYSCYDCKDLSEENHFDSILELFQHTCEYHEDHPYYLFVILLSD